MDRSVVPFGKPRAERADAARNREHLLQVAREMITEHGVEKVTMNGLAERAGLGKDTAFRRFGTRAGIIPHSLAMSESAQNPGPASPLGPLAGSWQALIERVCRTRS